MDAANLAANLDCTSEQQQGHASAPEPLAGDGAGAAAAETVGGVMGEAAAEWVAPSTSDPDPDGHQTSSSPNAQGNTSSQLPLGYMLVSVRLQGQLVLEELPVEVLPAHTFSEVCAAACARLQPALTSYDLQAYLRMEEINVDVPVQNPDTAVHDTLRAFPSVHHLVFDIAPAPVGRTARVKRAGPNRQPSRWPARLARLAVGVAKVVMAVELAAMIRGGGRGVVRQVRRALHGSSGEGGSSEEMGSETEAAVEAVGEYVAGRLGLEALQRYPQGVVRAALEAMDTEVMEQLDVPDVRTARMAVNELLAGLRAAGAAGAAGPGAAAAAGPGSAVRETGGRPQAGNGAGSASEAEEVADGVEAGRGAAARAGTGAKGAGSQAKADEPLPGFGPPPRR